MLTVFRDGCRRSADDRWFLKTAYALARESGDPSTQNGAVLVSPSAARAVAFGSTNPHPSWADTPERRVRPLKYQFYEHAERAAVYDAARRGVKTHGLTMYACWAACAECGRAVVMAGVKRLVAHHHPAMLTRPDWADSIAVADAMFAEGGVEVVRYEGVLGEAVLFGGRHLSV